jgi:DNA replication protein DnaC
MVFPKSMRGKFKTSVYRRATEIFVDLKDSFRTSEAKSEGEVIRYLSSAGLLVIDEFQERSESKWENRIITTIIDRRYSDNLPTILIANIELAEMGAKISDSIISRVNESGGVIECRAKNFRANQK